MQKDKTAPLLVSRPLASNQLGRVRQDGLRLLSPTCYLGYTFSYKPQIKTDVVLRYLFLSLVTDMASRHCFSLSLVSQSSTEAI